MTFNAVEISEYFAPIELYQFTRGSFSWYYTSRDRDVIFEGNTYLSTPIRRASINSTQDVGKTSLKIITSIRNAFVSQFIASPPSDTVEVTVRRIHAANDDPAITFLGRVVNVAFANNNAEVICQAIQSTLRRPGLRRLYQTSCPHALYGPQCSANRLSFQTMAVLTGVSGLSLSSPSFRISVNSSFDATWFSGGYVDFTINGLVDRRFITNHDNVAGTLTINLPFVGVVVGSEVVAFAGCDHAPETCANKFGNIENYGAFPFIPQKNPMNGTSIF